MNISEFNASNTHGILPPCSVRNCINYMETNDCGIVHEHCKIEHFETLRPCKYFEKIIDNQ